mgnify:CR=1 FL=1
MRFLPPASREIDEAHAELARRDLAGVAEVLRDLVGQDREVERGRWAARRYLRRRARPAPSAGERTCVCCIM